ncbi:DUF1843 domain-containing protein (plasmid) [Azospirillum humicireducens]|uniref:DUF1843 domain-containing protein n=1 Tax=Azospirillum humicireducens TaxID=1226968 RepID=A0A2R4VWI3_9PROT|nr:DUF1843 domain-containing protein [Azospirillum humicireducens]AWB08785.1 DUF1843 domain-containing protein [Azospirillum humicireducens]
MSTPPIRMLYGGAMTEAIASGDLSKMKEAAAAAETHVAAHGDVASMLETLKVEIAKAEAKG